ncbi:enoyl-CoA hydratase/isomerase family protein [Sinimarinibacterium sp. CAU 1509]|uniref:enoyl-CoA hydratase-related protein n=1 Tax=Sinimarinibacterium sp. CAU 1509 TaxID=2562283 RepID=UPI0010AD4C21|nr:enoyl-CoA hydratase-related protein [Sinimarinibacterium sp. CAU 1509]TJY64886.1 enoyl-CoA hydratase/isomerase family protein [Sinimarinibacterium sp. CAU 1509]
MSEPVLIERRGAVCWITLNREERRNALNEQVVRTIDAAIAEANNDRECRAIVITGIGDKAFCAGADLAKNAKGFAFDVDFSRPKHYIVDLFKRLQECTLPVIARVNGHVMAGGFGLLCACDMAIAADDIRIGTTEAKIGVTPMMILPYMLRILPARKLQEMCITGEQFSAQEALEWGVVNYVVPRAELDAKIDWLLSRVTNKSSTAIRLGKQAYNAMRDMGLRESLEYAQVMVPVMSSTADAKEGMGAFQEKRSPNWTGR